MKKKILSLVLVCTVLMSCFRFVALAESMNDAPASAEEKDDETPQVMVTEGELQTLKSVDALNVGDVYVPKDTNTPIMELSEADGSIMSVASGKLHIPVTNYTSRTDDYNESFSCDSDDGNRLNIWVKNNGKNTAVLNVEWSKFFGIVNEQYAAVEIAAGDQYTMTFYYEDGRGISGNWDVNVTTLSGGLLDITVSARQYQYNRSVESSPTGNPDEIASVIYNTATEVESSVVVDTIAMETERTGKVDAESYYLVDETTDVGVVGFEDGISSCEVSDAMVGNVDGSEKFADYVVCETTLIAIDDTTYNIVASNGEVIGVYNEEPAAITRGSWRYSWTVADGMLVGSDDPVSSYSGFVMSFTMTFSSKGDSYIGVVAVDDNIFYKVFDKSDSFSGTITLHKDLGDVAFAVKNCSGHSITYSGTLSY